MRREELAKCCDEDPVPGYQPIYESIQSSKFSIKDTIPYAHYFKCNKCNDKTDHYKYMIDAERAWNRRLKNRN